MTTLKNSDNRLSNKICPEGMSIEEWQVALRQENARDAQFLVEHLDDNRIWGDYLVSSGAGRYRTAFRGVCSDRNFCSCLDFRTNGLGTCKHLEAVALFLQEHVPGYPWAGMTFTPSYTSIYVSYKGGRSIRMRLGTEHTDDFMRIYEQFFTEDGVLPSEHYGQLRRIEALGKSISPHFRLYEDVYDYATEVLEAMQWRKDLLEIYPEERVPWDREHFSEAHRALEYALYHLCHGRHGLLVAPRHSVVVHLIARLAEEVYQGIQAHKSGYIVVESDVDAKLWQSILAEYTELQQLPIRILTHQLFVSSVGSEYTDASFVYIDNASGLKNWQNPVSIALKKLTVDHLYMRLETLQTLTPVQLSSILQHISPFVMGPLYQFVHENRPIFPLRDDGSNMPRQTAELIYLYPTLPSQVDLELIGCRQIPSSSVPVAPEGDSQQRVRTLLKAFLDVAGDPQALELLRQQFSL